MGLSPNHHEMTPSAIIPPKAAQISCEKSFRQLPKCPYYELKRAKYTLKSTCHR